MDMVRHYCLITMYSQQITIPHPWMFHRGIQFVMSASINKKRDAITTGRRTTQHMIAAMASIREGGGRGVRKKGARRLQRSRRRCSSVGSGAATCSRPNDGLKSLGDLLNRGCRCLALGSSGHSKAVVPGFSRWDGGYVFGLVESCAMRGMDTGGGLWSVVLWERRDRERELVEMDWIQYAILIEYHQQRLKR